MSSLEGMFAAFAALLAAATATLWLRSVKGPLAAVRLRRALRVRAAELRAFPHPF